MLGVAVLLGSPNLGMTLSGNLEDIRVNFTSKGSSCSSLSVEIGVSQVVGGLFGESVVETVRGLEVVGAYIFVHRFGGTSSAHNEHVFDRGLWVYGAVSLHKLFTDSHVFISGSEELISVGVESSVVLGVLVESIYRMLVGQLLT